MRNFWIKQNNAKKRGFPSDDALSLMQLCGGDGNLDHWYPHQFVQNERPVGDMSGLTQYTAYLEHKPVLPSSMTATVYIEGQAVQTMVEDKGLMIFADIGKPLTKAVGGTLCHNTGELELIFNQPTDECYCVVSYEYNMEVQQDISQNGFPPDDSLSLQQRASGDGTLDLY